ncbi:NAD(P)-dependent oxidoreductase [Thioclava indica]|uniref:3-phosphoglycerate dehydrogenase n=1 Tax=Thioclava indica TaxID=1353528 RepID=A0A074JY16_9RHOB|nr:NAD(P)-dependent oxidoreductase [Thioclava indica]KEO60775.1 hypothetical protein DT23_12480 [Thioclava indica]
MIKVLALDPIHEAGLAMLHARQDIELVHLPQPDDASIAKHMADAEILILRGRHLDPALFDTAKSLRLVSRHGVGCDNLDFAQMGRNSVTVAVSADANYVSVAEHAFALMLAGCRNLIAADQAVRSGDWARRDALGGRDVQGSKILVVGFGRIGQAFAARAAAFGGEVTVFDPYLPADVTLPAGLKLAENRETAVGEADIVSLHLPHSPQTANMVDAALLAQFRAGAILVNTGRGGIVDEHALLAALDAGRPALYATDVLASEPPAQDDPLLSRKDVIVTPHSAAMTEQGAMRMATGAAQNALDFLDGTLPDRMVAFAPS